MSKLTPKQLLFIQHKALGYSNAKAMVAAGYSENGAAQAGSLLAKRADVQTAIKKAKRDKNFKTEIAIAVRGKADPGEFKMPRKSYSDPADCLHDLMNHEGLPMVMRKDAAKDLMPYKHARIGEKGKKETAKDDAHKIARGGKNKFATQKPPSLPAGVADLGARRAKRNPDG